MSERKSLVEKNSSSGSPSSAKDYKSIEMARTAFQEGDVGLSRSQHQMHHPEPHGSEASDYVKSVVFGGLDGIMTTFAIIAAAAGSNANFATILVFGFSNVVADAFSMGFGEYVSGTAELDHGREERKREEWEVETSKDLEIAEMTEVYQQKGLSEEDAAAIVAIISKDDKIFVDFMMHDELGISIDLDDQWEPLKQGAVMFLSFILFGSVPLFAYLLRYQGSGIDETFWLACGFTGVALLVLGAIKGHLTGVNIPKSSMLMLLNGLVSGVVSFGLSSLIEGIVRPQ
jgi:vacuolar iron transporter family protein